MKPEKIAAIILIIAAGIAGSYFIIKGSYKNVFSQNNEEFSRLAGEIIDKNPVKWIEELKDLSVLGGFLDESNSSGNNSAGSESVNLTGLVAGSIFNKLKELDQNNNNPFTGSGFDTDNPEDQALLAETVNSLQGSEKFFDQPVDDSDLKISQDNSKKSQAQYLETISDISTSNLGDTRYQRSAEEIIQETENNCLYHEEASINLKLAAAYEKTAQEYLSVDAPSDFTALHKQMVGYFKKGNLIYEALGNCSYDPIKGYLAAQELASLISEARVIQQSLAEKVASIGL